MRKLAIVSFYFAVAIFLSGYLIAHSWLLICGGIAAVFSFTGLLFRGNNRKRIVIAILAIAIGFLWFWTYSTVFVQPYLALHEETISTSVTITDYPVARRTRGYRVDASMRLVGQRTTNVRLYYYNDTELKPGDIVEVTAQFQRTDITSDGDRFDALISRGIPLSARVSGELSVIDFDSSIRYLPKRVAEAVAQQIDDIFPKDISAFMQALLMGKRDELYSDTSLTSSLSASGIIHIVSVSGMHIAFLMGFLAQIIRSKKLFSFYGIPILLFFMAMTGFTPAVSRAGIMQIFLLCAPIFRRERDSITSLSFALLVLLILNPFAITSIGLQLSFSATLGIILFTSKIRSKVMDSFRSNRRFRKKIPRAILNFVTSNLATTIGALIFTIPLTVIHFGYVSIIAPITNLLTIGVVSIVFPLGLVAVLFSFLIPILGGIIAFPVSQAARYIIYVARTFATIPFSIVYTTNAHIMLWLAYVYLMFSSLPLLKARFRQYILPICISLMLLFILILVTPLSSVIDTNSITVVDVGQGLSVVVTSDDFTMVVDCGSISENNPGEIVHEFLMNIGRTSIDLLALTHFHSDHSNGVEFLLSRMSISVLAIPDPQGDFIAYSIIELARSRGTDIIYVTETLSIELNDSNDTTIIIYPPMGVGDPNEQGISVLTIGEVTALITGDMASSTERALLRFASLPKLDVLVVGHHGSRHSTSDELLDALLPDIAVISVGRNSFGHPAQEVLDRLARVGAIVYRTNEHGHVTIRAPLKN